MTLIVISSSSLQITLECVVASVLCSLGVVSAMGKFTDIRLTTELNTK